MGQGLKKKQHWQSAFNEEFLSSLERPFRYGRHDCCLGPARLIYAMTGKRTAGIFRKYDKDSFQSLLDEFGGIRGVAEHAASHYSLERIPVQRATGGDVVVVRMEEEVESLGIVALDGRFVYVASKPKGWGRFPLADAVVAYRVP